MSMDRSDVDNLCPKETSRHEGDAETSLIEETLLSEPQIKRTSDKELIFWAKEMGSQLKTKKELGEVSSRKELIKEIRLISSSDAREDIRTKL